MLFLNGFLVSFFLYLKSYTKSSAGQVGIMNNYHNRSYFDVPSMMCSFRYPILCFDRPLHFISEIVQFMCMSGIRNGSTQNMIGLNPGTKETTDHHVKIHVKISSFLVMFGCIVLLQLIDDDYDTSNSRYRT